MSGSNVGETEQPVIFKNNLGQKLFGVLHLPVSKASVPIAVMAHGFTDDKTGDNRLFVRFAREAARKGLAVFRFDFAGSGDSEGDFSHMTIQSEVEDLRGAIDFIHKLPEIDTSRVYLIGYSLGGAVSILQAADDLRVKGFIGWAPASNPLAVFQKILGKKSFAIANQKGFVSCRNGNKQFTLRKEFFKSVENADLIPAVNKISPRPILIIQGTRDKKIKTQETKAFFEGLKGLQKIHIINGAEHSFALYEDELITVTLKYLLDWSKGGVNNVI
jgi:alpha/beta superfamily hydrolase